jgi:hypothetical protein
MNPINPQHYRNHESGIEAIEITEHMDFCLGNAFKYLFRCGHKGNRLEDLEKALWYLKRARSRRTNPWWLRFYHSGYSLTLDSPKKIHQVVDTEHRYSGHMASALGNVWAAQECFGIVEQLDRAIHSVRIMIRMEQLQGEDAV